MLRPCCRKNTIEYFKNSSQLKFFANQYEALDGVDALVIPTEWKAFRNPDFELIKSKMKAHIIFDGRNIYKSADIRSLGFDYTSIGRP